MKDNVERYYYFRGEHPLGEFCRHAPHCKSNERYPSPPCDCGMIDALKEAGALATELANERLANEHWRISLADIRNARDRWCVMLDSDSVEEGILNLQGELARVKAERDELETALGGMVAAFDPERKDWGDESIMQTTRECALSVARQALGWWAEIQTT